MKQVVFNPKTKEAETLVPMPTPARKSLPDWYKQMPAFRNNKMKINGNGMANLTQKMCVPFSDSLSAGYIQTTWCDIHVETMPDGNVQCFYSGPPQIIDIRKDGADKDYDKNFLNIEFLWKVQWIPKLPKGYSMLYTHPLNRDDLPFYTFSGIVDSDTFFVEDQGNHPFLIKKGFEGMIPAGTPMFQMIPFKRDGWESVRGELDPDMQLKSKSLNKHFWGTYKKEFWKKKIYK